MTYTDKALGCIYGSATLVAAGQLWGLVLLFIPLILKEK